MKEPSQTFGTISFLVAMFFQMKREIEFSSVMLVPCARIHCLCSIHLLSFRCSACNLWMRLSQCQYTQSTVCACWCIGKIFLQICTSIYTPKLVWFRNKIPSQTFWCLSCCDEKQRFVYFSKSQTTYLCDRLLSRGREFGSEYFAANNRLLRGYAHGFH